MTNAYDALYNGNISTFGESFPGIGPTPGSIVSIMSYGALLLWNNPMAIMTLIIILRVASFIILSACLKRFFSNITMCWFSAGFLLSPFILYNTTITQDAFLLFGVSAVFASYIMLRRGSAYLNAYNRTVYFTYDNKWWAFFGTITLVLGLGWCLETDYIGIIPVILTICLYVRRMLAFSITGFLIGGSIVGLSIYPYIQELISNETLRNLYGQDEEYPLFYGLTHVYPLFIAIFDFLRIGTTNFTHYLIKEFDPSLFTQEPLSRAISNVWIIVLYIVGIFTFIINAGAWALALKYSLSIAFKNKVEPDKQQFLILIAFFTFFAILLTAAVYTDKLPFVALGALLPLAMLPTLHIIEMYNKHDKKAHFAFLIIVISFLTIVNLCGATSSGHFSSEKSLNNQITESLNAIRLTDDSE